MTTVTIRSDFGAQGNKIFHCVHFFPFYLPWSDGTKCHDLSHLMLVSGQLFHSLLSPSSRGSLVLRFLPLEWCHLYIWDCCYFFWQSWFQLMIHPARDFILYTLHRSYKQGDNTQPCSYSFPVLNQSVVPYTVLTCCSWPAYRFLKKQVIWSGILISLRIFHNLLWSTQSMTLV